MFLRFLFVFLTKHKAQSTVFFLNEALRFGFSVCFCVPRQSMKVYLDLCCFNRPFDDQSQLLVRLQTEAKLAIQESIRTHDHALIWSAILDLENTGNPDPERQAASGYAAVLSS